MDQAVDKIGFGKFQLKVRSSSAFCWRKDTQNSLLNFPLIDWLIELMLFFDRLIDWLIGWNVSIFQLSCLAGFAWMADAMEMMILSILSPALKCEWDLNGWQQALVTTVRLMQMDRFPWDEIPNSRKKLFKKKDFFYSRSYSAEWWCPGKFFWSLSTQCALWLFLKKLEEIFIFFP